MNRSPGKMAGTPGGYGLIISAVMLLLELEDVDNTFSHAVAMGARVEMPVAEMFWGERYGIVRDPFGHHWHWALCRRREHLSPDEVADRVPAEPTDGTWASR